MEGTILSTTCSKVWTLSWVSGQEQVMTSHDFLEAELSLTYSFSRVHSPGKTQGDEARFWWLLCVTSSERSLVNIHISCHEIYSLFRAQGYGTFPPLKADGSPLPMRREDEGWDEALQQREKWSRAMRGLHRREVQHGKGQSLHQVLKHMWNPSGSLFPWYSVVWAITWHPTGRERHPVGRGKSYLCF